VRVVDDDIVIGAVAGSDVAENRVSAREHVDTDRVTAHVVSFDAAAAVGADTNPGAGAPTVFGAIVIEDVHKTSGIRQDAAIGVLIAEGAFHRSGEGDVHARLRVIGCGAFGDMAALKASNAILVVGIRGAL
jgi:hypothetical protein